MCRGQVVEASPEAVSVKPDGLSDWRAPVLMLFSEVVAVVNRIMKLSLLQLEEKQFDFGLETVSLWESRHSNSHAIIAPSSSGVRSRRALPEATCPDPCHYYPLLRWL